MDTVEICGIRRLFGQRNSGTVAPEFRKNRAVTLMRVDLWSWNQNPGRMSLVCTSESSRHRLIFKNSSCHNYSWKNFGNVEVERTWYRIVAAGLYFTKEKGLHFSGKSEEVEELRSLWEGRRISVWKSPGILNRIRKFSEIERYP